MKVRDNERSTLVQNLIAELRSEIEDGAIPVGSKLFSESQLTAKYGVSRTVVREAIAGLRTEGLVEARQGAGVFVISSTSSAIMPFAVVDMKKLSSIVEMMEFRIAIEVEAASLAAIRRSPAQEAEIVEMLLALEDEIAEGKVTADSDLNFHMAIARATNNPRFVQFLEMLGDNAIPRSQIADGKELDDNRDGFYQHLQDEHRQITQAISAGDAVAAREAMRTHLEGGLRRYREMRQSLQAMSDNIDN